MTRPWHLLAVVAIVSGSAALWTNHTLGLGGEAPRARFVGSSVAGLAAAFATLVVARLWLRRRR
jgi:VIT1/CCC1 family predicted Fe2+/Mn2+ transporter